MADAENPQAVTPDYILEIPGLAGRQGGEGADGEPARPRPPGQPWVGIYFDCCGVYARIYRNRPGTAYVGYCPRCRAKVRLLVGPDGTDARIFRAS